MSALEVTLILAAGILALLLAISLLLLLRRRVEPPAPRSLDLLAGSLADVGIMKAHIDGILQAQQTFRDSLARLETGLSGVQTKVVESGSGVRESLQRDLQGARATLDSLKVAQDARKSLEDDLRDSTRRIEAVIAGSRSRGVAGENILAESLRHLPPTMLETDFKVGNKPVEFALKLADGTRVPIDSKWPRADLLEQLDGSTTPEQEAELVAQLEKAVELKVREAARYIDAGSTTPWAVAAVPDGVFGLCRRAHFEAQKSKVVLMSYSLAVPYLLSLYNLHLQFCRSIQVERVERYLIEIEHAVEKLDKEFEGRMSDAIVRLENSRNECHAALGKMRNAAASLRSMPATQDVAPGGKNGDRS